MKTILISVFDSNMVRNILRTDVLTTITKSPEVGKVVLLVLPIKVEEYKKEFQKGKVEVRSSPQNLASRAELVTWFLLRHTIPTQNVRNKIRELYYTSGGGQFARTAKWLAALCAFYASKFPPIDWLLRRIAFWAHQTNRYQQIVDEVAPDLVFLPTIFATNDIRLLKYCVQKKIPTVGMIKSWDNLLGKDPLLVWPEKLIVHNDLVKGYAREMHNYPEERICVTGIPQMDVYADPTFVIPREEFFRSLGLDPSKKLLVYTAVGILISYYEVEVIKMLSELVRTHAFGEPTQLLVRLHPAYPSDDTKIRAIPGITIVRPGKVGAEGNPLRFDFEFQEQETRELASTMKWADVVLQSGSTIAIDAACFDTPLVSIGFDGEEAQILERSAKRLLIKDHFQKILDTGGTRAVYTKEELVSAVKAYLADQSLDAAGRKKIVEEQCYELDGHAGERVGECVLDHLKHSY